jgi:4'-phosphopantetheinyl transferase
MVRIYALKLPTEGLFYKHYEALKMLLPGDIFQIASKFRFIQGVQRKILGDALMRVAVGLNYGIKPDEIRISVGTAGKPYLLSHPNIFYNISHSGEWVVVALSDFEVGIDVEKVKKVNISIAERFFSEDEKKQLFSLPENSRIEHFFDLWTLKESFLKAIGTGLTKPLNCFSVRKIQDRFIVLNYENETSFFLKQLHLREGYKMAVCAWGDIIDDHLNIVDFRGIVKMLQNIQGKI